MAAPDDDDDEDGDGRNTTKEQLSRMV